MSINEFDTRVLESLPIAVGLANMDGRVLFLNSRFFNLFGFTIEDIPTIDIWFDLAYPESDYRSIVFEGWQNKIQSLKPSLEEEWSEIVEITCKNGICRRIEMSLKVINNLIYCTFNDVAEILKTKEVALNERFFTSTLVKKLPGIFFIYEYLNGEFFLRRWNDNLQKLTGYSSDQLEGENLLNFFSIEYAHDVYESCKKTISDGFHREIAAPIKRKDQSIVPYYWIGDRLLFDNKIYLVGQGIDITKQIESEGKFKAIFDNLPDAIIISKSKEEPLLAANKAFTKLTGYSKEWLINKLEDSEFQKSKDFQIILNKLHEFQKSDKTSSDIIEHNIFSRTGEIKRVNSIFTKILFDNTPAILSIIRDITKHKQAEAALLLSEKRMSTIFDSAPVIMMVINEDGEILDINKKGKKTLTLEKKPIAKMPVGKAYNCIYSHKTSFGCGLSSDCNNCTIRNTITDTILHNTNFEKVPVKVQSIDKTYHLLMSSSLLHTEKSKELLLTFDDITKQKKIEEDLRKSREKAIESDKLKSAFLQNMSHEIRTPLNGILGFSNLLNSEDLSKEDKDYYIEVINQSSNQLLGIVDDILNISRLETGQIEVLKEEVSVNNLLQELYEYFSFQFLDKNLVLSYSKDLGDTESVIYTDFEKLRQTLVLLLNNALKFTQQGHVLFGYILKNKYLEFYVEDTGIGIASEFHNKIFDRFQQVDSKSTRVYGGTGLGLAIAKGNIELLDGKIWLESTPNIGSKFAFAIPYNPVHTIISDIKSSSAGPSSLNQEAILIAEDEEINFLFIAEALKNTKYQLFHAFDGKEAIDIFKNHNNIVLALIDIKMPIMDGYDTLKIIHKIAPELPVIAQTAYAMLSDKEKILNAGFSDYLAKPIKKTELLKAIDKHLKIKS